MAWLFWYCWHLFCAAAAMVAAFNFFWVALGGGIGEQMHGVGVFAVFILGCGCLGAAWCSIREHF